MSISLPELLSASFDLAQRAGEIIKSIANSNRDLQVVDKNLEPSDCKDRIFDPTTIADLTSQKLIVGSLKRQWPQLDVLGEEGQLEVTDNDVVQPNIALLQQYQAQFPGHLRELPYSGLVVWVDPLDGTREYTDGVLEAVTVLIGISYEGRALAGVIHHPFSGRTLWGMIGVGAFGHLYQEPPAQRRILTTSRSHNHPILKRWIETLPHDQVVRVGGCGYKSLMVLDGQADAYIYPIPGTKKWDTCACDAIVRAAGGTFTDGNGNELSYEKEGDPSNQVGLVTAMKNHASYLVQLNH
eukprot:TRINITY_DN16502_c0_g1_i2.p1 TRINITY_DN16502_c0_g1~~TRINITY_DN16502_c0_g1_i2.p1  ORF type:complete len:326 (+),score=73.92 TRINITY_DN16502_c0_g1_i2:88-978(+)